MTAGRLEGTLDGRPVSITAEGDTMTLQASRDSLRALINQTNTVRPVLRDAGSRLGLKVRVKIGGFPSIRFDGVLSRVALAIVAR